MLSQAPKLEPLNEGGGAALLQVVSLEVNLFCLFSQQQQWGLPVQHLHSLCTSLVANLICPYTFSL